MSDRIYGFVRFRFLSEHVTRRRGLSTKQRCHDKRSVSMETVPDLLSALRNPFLSGSIHLHSSPTAAKHDYVVIDALALSYRRSESGCISRRSQSDGSSSIRPPSTSCAAVWPYSWSLFRFCVLMFSINYVILRFRRIEWFEEYCSPLMSPSSLSLINNSLSLQRSCYVYFHRVPISISNDCYL